MFFQHQRDPMACRMAAMPPREWDAFERHWRSRVLLDAVLKRTIALDGPIASRSIVGSRVVGNVLSWTELAKSISAEPRQGSGSFWRHSVRAVWLQTP